MRTSNHQIMGGHEVPVRWYDRGWSLALNAAEAPSARPAASVRKAARAANPRVPSLRLPRIPVTVRKRLSQFARSPRARR